MLAKRVLDKQIRVPNITLVKDSKSKETGIEIGKEIGKGGFSKVKLCKNKNTQKK